MAMLVLLVGTWVGIQAYASRSRRGSEAPDARVEWTRWDFGRVRAGERLSVTCIIRNEGGRRLVIQPQGRSCACARGGSGPIVVQPGSAVDLVESVDTHDLQGPIQFELKYSTSDPQLPEFSLVLCADIYVDR